jgi:hypothetical protein
MFPSLYEHSKKKNRIVAEALHNGNWISDLMQDITTLLFGEYVLLWALVESANFDPMSTAEVSGSAAAFCVLCPFVWTVLC